MTGHAYGLCIPHELLIAGATGSVAAMSNRALRVMARQRALAAWEMARRHRRRSFLASGCQLEIVVVN